jgi:hypothetical protein
MELKDREGNKKGEREERSKMKKEPESKWR